MDNLKGIRFATAYLVSDCGMAARSRRNDDIQSRGQETENGNDRRPPRNEQRRTRVPAALWLV